MTGNLAIFSGLWIQNTFLTVGPSTAGNTLQKNMMIYTLSPPALIKKKVVSASIFDNFHKILLAPRIFMLKKKEKSVLFKLNALECG